MASSTTYPPAGSSPIRKLGPEILLSIFKTCIDTCGSGGLIAALEDNRLVTAYVVPSYWTHPFLLSAVCSEWRKLCIGNTFLWDTICLWLVHSGKTGEPLDNFEQVMFAFKLWIERSGTERPLKIIIGHHLYGKAPEIPKTLAKHASRISQLELSLPTDWYPALARIRFPLLKRTNLYGLEIANEWSEEDATDISEWQQVSSTTIDLSGSPKLTSAWIVGMPTRVSNIKLPWTQMTEIEVSHLVPGDCLKIFDLMPNLTTCTLEIVPFFGFLDEQGPEWPQNKKRGSAAPRRMPKLETLTLAKMCPEYANIILECLEASQLKAIHLGRLPQDLYEIYETEYSNRRYDYILKTIPKRFGHQLQTLTIDGTVPRFSVLSDALPLLPNLVTLKVDVGFRGLIRTLFYSTPDWPMAPDDAFFKNILTKPEVLPKLEVLYITARDIAIGDKAMLDFLRYRRHLPGDQIHSTTSAKIRDVHLISVESGFRMQESHSKVVDIPMWSAETVNEIRGMVEGGLNFSVRKVRDGRDQAGESNLLWRWHRAEEAM